MTDLLLLADWFTNTALSPLVERLGWTLLHSTWQFLAVALVWMFASRLMQRTSASARYGMTLAALVAIGTLPVITFVSIPHSVAVVSIDQPLAEENNANGGTRLATDVAALPAEIDATPPTTAGGPITPTNDPSILIGTNDPTPITSSDPDEQPAGAIGWLDRWSVRTSSTVRPWLPASVSIWLVGMMVFMLRPMLACRTIYQMRTRGITPISSEFATRVDRLAQRMGVRRAVSVVQSERVTVPAVIGFLRPMILLPASVLNEMTVRDLESIVAHELAHVLRHDYLVNGVQIAIETIFFYHPAVWYVSHQLRLVREDCCDDLALTVVPGRAEYARSLVALEELRGTAPSPALAANGGSLLGRVRRILAGGTSTRANRFVGVWQLVPLALAAIVFVAFLLPQASETEAAAPKIQWRQLTLLDATGQKAAKGTTVNVAQIGYSAEVPQLPALFVEDDGQVWLRDLEDGKHHLVARSQWPNLTPLHVQVPVPDDEIIQSLRPESERANEPANMRPAMKVFVTGEGLEQRITWKFDFTNAGEGAKRYDITEYDAQLIGNVLSARVLPLGIPFENVFVDPGGEYTLSINWIDLVQSGIWTSRSGDDISEPVIPVENGEAAFRSADGTAVILNDPNLMVRFVEQRRQATAKIEFEKKSFFLGENLLTHFGITNQSDQPLTIDVGGDYRGSPRHLRFVVVAYDQDGKLVVDPTPNPVNMGGISHSPTIAAGETFWMSLPLHRYRNFTEAGTYTIKIYHDLGWDGGMAWNFDFPNTLPEEGHIAPIATAKLKLRMPSIRQARRVLSEAIELPRETWTTGSGEKSKLFPEFEAMQFPVYVPLLKELAAEASDAARETDPERAKFYSPPPVAALGATATPEATRALIDLLAHEESQIASAALDKLLLRLPYPHLGMVGQSNEHFETTIARVKASWREEFRRELFDYAVDVLTHGNAAKYDNNLGEDTRQNLIRAATLAHGIARRADYDRLFAVYEKIIADVANDAAESAYPQPQTVSSPFSAALWNSILDGSNHTQAELLNWANNRVKVNGKIDLNRIDPFSFMRLVQTNSEFRPTGWEAHVANLIDHANVAVRAHVLFHLPKPLESEWKPKVERQLRESSPEHSIVFLGALDAVTHDPDPRYIQAIHAGNKRNTNKFLDHFIMHAVKVCKEADKKGAAMFGVGVESDAGLTGTLKIDEPVDLPDPWFWPDPYTHLGHVDRGGDGWRYLRIAGDRKAAQESGIPAATQANILSLYGKAQVASRGEANVAAIYQRYAEQAEELLTTDQHARIWQLIFQRMSYKALTREDVAERLDLSAKQREEIDRAIDDHLARLHERDAAIQAKIEQLKDHGGLVLQQQVSELKKLTDARGPYGRASHKQVWTDAHDILTAEQRELWNEMRGTMPKSNRRALSAFEGELD